MRMKKLKMKFIKCIHSSCCFFFFFRETQEKTVDEDEMNCIHIFKKNFILSHHMSN